MHKHNKHRSNSAEQMIAAAGPEGGAPKPLYSGTERTQFFKSVQFIPKEHP
jgi:hypothetical protein